MTSTNSTQLLLIYFLCTLMTLVFWSYEEKNDVTGDEPHYLVVASGIAKYGSLEQTAPYLDEFRSREIYELGLAPTDATPNPENTHVVAGPNGLYNVHNIGLPILLALPFSIGGVVGAKLFMVAVGALIVITGIKFASQFSDVERNRFWAVAAATISLPLIPAATQIYPDLPAGLICLVGLYWFFTLRKERPALLESAVLALIAFLPWLQIKFAAACVILIIAITARIYFLSGDLKRVIRLLLIAGLSCAALVAYNQYAFGKISGPYQSSNSLEFSKTSLVVLFGLFADQNQGFLLQNPVNLVGILAIGWLFKLDRLFTLVWALVFLSLIVPNGLHPNWYGGLSFSGRFQWAATIVFSIPTIFGLLMLAKNHRLAFKVVVALGLVLQAYFFWRYAFDNAPLYNKGAAAWHDAYSIFYFPVHSWLPMLHNPGVAFGYLPNYAWAILVAALFFIGFADQAKVSGRSRAALLAAASIILVPGFMSQDRPERSTFASSQLLSLTGRLVENKRIAEPGVDTPGFLTYGPYFPLRAGDYRAVISYKSSGLSSEVIGLADVYDATSGKQLAQQPLTGTENQTRQIVMDFSSDQKTLSLFEVRTNWNGSAAIEVESVTFETL